MAGSDSAFTTYTFMCMLCKHFFTSLFCSFLPAAKPSGHRMVRVVVVVVREGDYFEVMTLKVDLRSRSTFVVCSLPLMSHP